MSQKDPINELLTEHGSETHPAEIAEALDRQKRVNITPAPMSIENALAFYIRMNEEGRENFVSCFHEDDREVLQQAITAWETIDYDEGGLHRLEGKCIQAEVDPDAEIADPHGYYTIRTDDRTYRIYLNLPVNLNCIPPNTYPSYGDRVVVLAEGIEEDAGIFDGYAEICMLPEDVASSQLPEHVPSGIQIVVVS